MDANSLRERMARKGWSYRGLAENLDPPVSLGAITRWLSGDRRCPPWLERAMDSAERRVPVEQRRKRRPVKE